MSIVARAPKLSIVVITYDMRREAYRTIHSLTRGQVGVAAEEYDIVVVDNGSSAPVDAALFAGMGDNVRVVAMPIPSQSPAAALNFGASIARGDIIVSMIDGARMASPGCVAWTLRAFRTFDDPIVIVPAWHIGPDVQNKSVLHGYDRTVEDRLLGTIDWKDDGYRLFDVCEELDPSSAGAGWFSPVAESNFIGLRRADFVRLGGFDAAFSSRGGGAVNLDFFRRACEELRRPVVCLIGEGTFHQFHGGVSTNVEARDHPWAAIHDEYRRIRGRDFREPVYAPILLGHVGSHARDWLMRSRNLLTHSSKPQSFLGRVGLAVKMLARGA